MVLAFSWVAAVLHSQGALALVSHIFLTQGRKGRFWDWSGVRQLW